MTYRHTRIACYTGYIVQAIINLFPPLLFVRFQEEFGVTLPQLSLLVVMNFSTQIATDLLARPLKRWPPPGLSASRSFRPCSPESPMRDFSPRCSLEPSAAV